MFEYAVHSQLNTSPLLRNRQFAEQYLVALTYMYLIYTLFGLERNSDILSSSAISIT